MTSGADGAVVGPGNGRGRERLRRIIDRANVACCGTSYQVDRPRGNLFWKRSTCSVPSRSIPISIAIG